MPTTPYRHTTFAPVRSEFTDVPMTVPTAEFLRCTGSRPGTIGPPNIPAQVVLNQWVTIDWPAHLYPIFTPTSATTT